MRRAATMMRMRSIAGSRKVALRAVAVALALLAFLGAFAMSLTTGGLAAGCDGGTFARAAYAQDDESAATSGSGASGTTGGTSNKPETSPVTGSDLSAINELDSNVIDTSQLPDSSFLYDTSIVALTGADSYYDNQTVQVTGEAVGDSITAGFDDTHRWITLASTEVDESETLAVYMTDDFAQLVDGFGSYGRTGTVLQVRGTFHLACSEHDGTTDLHAENVSVIKVSESHPDVFEWSLFVPGLVLVVVGILALGAYMFIRERLR